MAHSYHCVCVVTTGTGTQAIHCPACPGLGVTRHAALARTSGHHSAPHPATPTARLQREYVCHGVWCAGRMCIVQLLTSSRRLRRWLRPTVSWPRGPTAPSSSPARSATPSPRVRALRRLTSLGMLWMQGGDGWCRMEHVVPPCCGESHRLRDVAFVRRLGTLCWFVCAGVTMWWCVCGTAGLQSLCGWCPFKAATKAKGHCVNIANRNAENKLCPITNNTILLQ